MSYASKTSVPVDRSKTEIERLLDRYGADKFMHGREHGRAVVGFNVHGRSLRFVLPIPSKEDEQFERTDKGRPRVPAQRTEAWEQEVRRLWRALLLTIKAKLESVESGIETFEHAFLANIVLPDGLTVAQHVIPSIAEAYETGRVPLLLPPAGGTH